MQHLGKKNKWIIWTWWVTHCSDLNLADECFLHPLRVILLSEHSSWPLFSNFSALTVFYKRIYAGNNVKASLLLEKVRKWPRKNTRCLMGYLSHLNLAWWFDFIADPGTLFLKTCLELCPMMTSQKQHFTLTVAPRISQSQIDKDTGKEVYIMLRFPIYLSKIPSQCTFLQMVCFFLTPSVPESGNDDFKFGLAASCSLRTALNVWKYMTISDSAQIKP